MAETSPKVWRFVADFVQEWGFSGRHYLCESGTNSELAMAMKPNAVRASSRPRYLSVVGRKARSRNKAIFSDLPLSSTAKDCTSAAEALLFYRDVVHDARQTNRKEPLFVHVAHGAVKR